MALFQSSCEDSGPEHEHSASTWSALILERLAGMFVLHGALFLLQGGTDQPFPLLGLMLWGEWCGGPVTWQLWVAGRRRCSQRLRERCSSWEGLRGRAWA